jgi:hypothetical protein
MGKAYNLPENALEGTIYDPNNPDSLINIIPERVRPVLMRIKDKMPRVLFQTEGELRQYIHPDDRDERLRLAFWDEYNHATAHGKMMSLSAFLHGVAAWETWVTVYEPNDKKMMWMFCPPVSYQSAMRNILHRGTERLMEIMSLPILDDQGKPDSKVIVNILRAFQLVDMRVKGAVTQKLQIQQQSLNVHATINQDMPNIHTGLPVDTLQLEELEKLERRIAQARRDSKRLAATMSPEDQARYLPELADTRAAKGVGGAAYSGLRQSDAENLDKDITLEIEIGKPGED